MKTAHTITAPIAADPAGAVRPFEAATMSRENRRRILTPAPKKDSHV